MIIMMHLINIILTSMRIQGKGITDPSINTIRDMIILMLNIDRHDTIFSTTKKIRDVVGTTQPLSSVLREAQNHYDKNTPCFAKG